MMAGDRSCPGPGGQYEERRRRLVVVDIGTHRAQEARAIADKSVVFELSILWSLVKHHRHRLGRVVEDFRSIRASRKVFETCELAFVFIEPIAYRQLRNLLPQLGAFAYIGGVCSERAAVGWVDLWLAKDGLGNSMFASKPNLTGRKVPVWNIKFTETMDWVDGNFRSAPDDVVVLRINAEGVELEVIESLVEATRQGHRRRVDAIFGSLGDIRKCFGTEAWEHARKLLGEMDLPYVYFTSSAGSWAPALRQLEALLVQDGVRR